MDPAYNQELYLDPELVNAVSNQIGDGGVANNGHINDHNNDHIGDFHDDVTANCLSRRRFTDAEFEERVSSLNDSQRVAYQMIVDYTRSSHNYLMGTRNTPPENLRLFITGGAGTGKSHVISVIKEHLERAHLGAVKACILMAPTGVAAFNIGGLTIHRALNLPVEHGRNTRYRPLNAEKLHVLRKAWSSVNTVVIDEISMVSYQTLYFVHRRLTEIKGTNDTETLFGGLNIIAVGDFYQLPPVRNKFVFQDGTGYNPGSTHLWRDQFRLIELTQNMRQRGDVIYSSLLNRVRTGSQTSDDMSLLRTRLTSGIHNSIIDLDQAPFVDALRLLPLKEQVNLYNQHCLEKLPTTTTVYEFSADHSILESSKQAVGVVSHNSVPEALIPPDDNDCAGLAH